MRDHFYNDPSRKEGDRRDRKKTTSHPRSWGNNICLREARVESRTGLHTFDNLLWKRGEFVERKFVSKREIRKKGEWCEEVVARPAERPGGCDHILGGLHLGGRGKGKKNATPDRIVSLRSKRASIMAARGKRLTANDKAAGEVRRCGRMRRENR